ncbi:hypothetical protein CRUP_023560 [Coryphaenoides rupestris]|nr:hypothetical protein CRUP_023560 [Coryphaenoides rupestris]
MRASWLVAVLAVLAVCCLSARASCWESSVCSDLRSNRRLLDCISVCVSRIQTELPRHRPASADEDEDTVLLDLLLSSLGAGPPDPRQPPGGSGAQGRSEDRRSYAMEHFRWGKPAGRKRRPVKVYAAGSAGAGGDDSVEGTFFTRRVRRLPPRGVTVSEEEEGEGDEGGKEAALGVPGDLQVQPLQEATFGPQQTGPLLSPQETKDPATYRMTHFRWGSPPKRHGVHPSPWEGKAKKPLSRFFGNSFKPQLH